MKKQFVFLMLMSFNSVLIAADATKAKVNHTNYKNNDCYTWSTYKVCVERKGNWHGVLTPSHVRSWNYKYDYSAKYYVNNKLTSEYAGKSKYMAKAKDGKTFVYKNKYKFQFASGCIQIDYKGDYQYVNGKVVRSKYKYDNASKCS